MLPLNVEARHINHLSRHFDVAAPERGEREGFPSRAHFLSSITPPLVSSPNTFLPLCICRGKKSRSCLTYKLLILDLHL